MSADILIVEDEAPKREYLIAFVRQEMPSAHIRVAKSVRSGIALIESQSPHLLLLDMSLPTFDIGPNEPGGRPQGFGGIEVLRYIELYELNVPTIVVTGYEAFTRGAGKTLDHDALDLQLRADHQQNYKGLVYYNSLFPEWRASLAKLMRTQIDDRRAK